MKPGQFPWSENEAYSGGPDVGNDTRTTPPTVNQNDGYYRTYRPAPDILNYQLHRAAKTQEFLARMQAMNVNLVDFYRTASSFSVVNAVTHGIGSSVLTDPRNYVFYYVWGGANVYEIYADDYQILGETAVFNPGGANTASDCDHENSKSNHHRIYVQDDGAGADWVYYATTLGGAYAQVNFTAGAPAYDWRAVGCDRDSSGSPLWLIGSAAMAGPTSYIFSSSNGINFANVAGWAAGAPNADAEDIEFIKHTKHEANALGPDDPGNASWLVLTSTYSVASSDGSTFTEYAHGMNLGGGSLHSKSAAYSRIGTRWICPRINSASGDVYYSDDNGQSWSTFSGVIPEVGSVSRFYVTCDYHGTFVATWSNSWPQYIVSVDNGETWSSPLSISLPNDYFLIDATPTITRFIEDGAFIPEFVIDEVSQAYGPPNGPEYLSMAALDTTTDVELYRSLMY